MRVVLRPFVIVRVVCGEVITYYGAHSGRCFLQSSAMVGSKSK